MHLACSAGIQTHDLLVILPLPLVGSNFDVKYELG